MQFDFSSDNHVIRNEFKVNLQWSQFLKVVENCIWGCACLQKQYLMKLSKYLAVMFCTVDLWKLKIYNLSSLWHDARPVFKRFIVPQKKNRE